MAADEEKGKSVIDSGEPISNLEMVRRAAGPNPPGSKLTGDERIHLMYMVNAMNQAGLAQDTDRELDYRDRIKDALAGRGLRTHQIADTFEQYGRSAADVVDALCVHPALREASHA